MQEYQIIIAIVALIIILNVFTTVTISMSEGFERSQKIYQICVVWLVPILGGIGILIAIKNITHPPAKKEPTEFGGGPQDTGYGPD